MWGSAVYGVLPRDRRGCCSYRSYHNRLDRSCGGGGLACQLTWGATSCAGAGPGCRLLTGAMAVGAAMSGVLAVLAAAGHVFPRLPDLMVGTRGRRLPRGAALVPDSVARASSESGCSGSTTWNR